MFKEILKIIPVLANGDLNKMERQLGSRFLRISKKFGKGLFNAVRGGGFAGVALGLIDKLLNPLKETQDALDRSLKTADDLATNAKQFGTDAGKLAKLQAFAKTAGLDSESLFMLISKFQGAVAEAALDPSKPSPVSAFINEKDTSEGFFQFIQALKAADPNKQRAIQEQVFGEKQVLKMSEFLNSDFPTLVKQFARFKGEDLNKAISVTSSLADKNDNLTAVRELEDLLNKGSQITSSTIQARDQAERLNLEREGKQLQAYKELSQLNQTVEGVLFQFKSLGVYVIKGANAIVGIFEQLQKFKGSRLLKGLFGSEGK